MKKSKKMRDLMAEIGKAEKPKKQKAPAYDPELDANKDGKMDEKDASAFEKAAKAVKKRIRKKKEK